MCRTDTCCASAHHRQPNARPPHICVAGQREGIEKEAAGAEAELAAAGAALSLRRRGAAGHLRAAVEAQLAELAMAGSRFDVRIGWESLPAVLRPPIRTMSRYRLPVCGLQSFQGSYSIRAVAPCKQLRQKPCSPYE